MGGGGGLRKGLGGVMMSLGAEALGELRRPLHSLDGRRLATEEPAGGRVDTTQRS